MKLLLNSNNEAGVAVPQRHNLYGFFLKLCKGFSENAKPAA